MPAVHPILRSAYNAQVAVVTVAFFTANQATIIAGNFVDAIWEALPANVNRAVVLQRWVARGFHLAAGAAGAAPAMPFAANDVGIQMRYCIGMSLFLAIEHCGQGTAFALADVQNAARVMAARGCTNVFELFATVADFNPVNVGGAAAAPQGIPPFIQTMLSLLRAGLEQMEKAEAEERKRLGESSARQNLVLQDQLVKYGLQDLGSHARPDVEQVGLLLTAKEKAKGIFFAFVYLLMFPFIRVCDRWRVKDEKASRNAPVTTLHDLNQRVAMDMSSSSSSSHSTAALLQEQIDFNSSSRITTKLKESSPQVYLAALIFLMTSAGAVGLLGDSPIVVTLSYVGVVAHLMSKHGVLHGIEYDRLLRRKAAQLTAADGDFALFKEIDTETYDAAVRSIEHEQKMMRLAAPRDQPEIEKKPKLTPTPKEKGKGKGKGKGKDTPNPKAPAPVPGPE